jgi:DNA invertase Pin-like site-specific DNA recombinase
MLQWGYDMAKIGYIRVSTDEQNTDRQHVDGMDKIFVDKVSGGSTSGRQALVDMIDWVREGDEVIVHSIDRLARNLADLQNIIKTLNDKGVTVRFVTEGLSFSHDVKDAMSRLQLQMMGAFAEFERSLIKSRQLEGIAKAKAKGVYKGRVKAIDDGKIVSLRKQGVGVSDIAKMLTISRMSVYRALEMSSNAAA